MRKILLMAAGAALIAIPAAAQDTRISGNLFISPCGEPFSASKKAAYPIVDWFNGADANHDGKLDIDEMRNDAARFFKVLDRNGDGVIDSQEVTYYETHIAPELLANPGREANPSAGLDDDSTTSRIKPDAGDPDELNANLGAASFSLFREPEPVRSADRDFDQRITLKEFLAHSDRHFHALDVANLGYLTLASLPKTEAEKAFKAHR